MREEDVIQFVERDEESDLDSLEELLESLE